MQDNIIRVVLGTVSILLVPLTAMQFTDEVNWNLTDFVVMGALLFGTGLTYVLVMKKVNNVQHRIAIGAALLIALVLVWTELAVGIFGTPFAGS